MINLFRNQERIKWTIPVHSARNTLLKLKKEMGMDLVYMTREQLRNYCLEEDRLQCWLTIFKVSPLEKLSTEEDKLDPMLAN
jgi:hypothetical protein